MPIAPESDYQTYYDIATLLSQGNLIKDGVGACDYISQFPHVIGYPYILSKIFKIFGVSVSVGLYFNLVVSLISIFLAYRIARLMCGKLGGMIALVLVAFWPSQILYINHIASEPVFTCMALFSLWLAVYLFKSPFGKSKASACLFLYIFLGISLALGAAVRPMSIILLIAIIISTFHVKIKINEDKNSVGLIKRGMSKGWLRVLVILVSYLVCSQIISGAIAKAIDRELPDSSVSFGYNLLVGLNIEFKGAWNEQDSKLMNNKFLETDSATEAHRTARDEALKRFEGNTIGIVNLAFQKYALLWERDDYASYLNISTMEKQNTITPEKKALISGFVLWNNLYYLLTIFLSLLMGVSLWYKKKVGPEHILILFFIGTAILHMILESQNRYHYNILPIFAILAANGCVEFFHRYSNKTSITIDGYKSSAMQQSVITIQEELTAAPEPPSTKQEEKDNKFDMLSAIQDGHVVVTVSEAYLKSTQESK